MKSEHMKPILVILITILLLYTNAQAQTTDLAKILKDNSFSAEYIQDLESCFRLSNSKLVTVSVKGGYITIVKYNENLSPESNSNPIKFTYNQDVAKCHYKGMYIIKGDKILVRFIQKMKDEKKIIVWANVLNIEDEEFENTKPVKLNEIDYSNKFKNLGVYFSPDKTKMTLVSYLTVKKPYNRIILTYKTFTDELKLI